jgi:hypothetical protein
MHRPAQLRAAHVAILAAVLTSAAAASAQSEVTRTIRLGGGLVEVQITRGAPGGSSPAVAEQIARLLDQDPTARLEAARALGELGDPVAVAPLARTARADPHPEIRGWALRALHQIGTPEAVDVIRDVGSRDADQRVQGLAERLLADVDGAPAPASAVGATNLPAAPVEADEPGVAADAGEPAAEPGEGDAALEPADDGAAPAGAASPFGLQASVVLGGPELGVGQEPQVVLMPEQIGGPGFAGAAVDHYQISEARRQRRAGLGLRIAGWTMFGLTYFSSFMAGVAISQEDSDDGWPLMIPLVGPAIVGFRLFDEEEATGLGVLAIVWSILEVAGLTMAVAGHVRRARARRQVLQVGGSGPGRRVAVVPQGPAGSAGLSLAASF